jgi:hypothetical protein
LGSIDPPLSKNDHDFLDGAYRIAKSISNPKISRNKGFSGN